MVPCVPFRPQAVVFDLDGLLVDSEPLWAAAERAVVESFGGTWRAELQRLMLGKSPEAAAATMAAHVGVADVTEVGRRLQAASEREFRRGVPLRPGAARLVGSLAGRVPLGVATNSRPLLAALALTSAGIAEAIDTVVTPSDVARPKPAPDPYATACERLGADPSRCVAFEDSPLGVRSAVAAGLWVVGCPSFEHEMLEGAHAVVASLTDVDPGALLPAA